MDCRLIGAKLLSEPQCWHIVNRTSSFTKMHLKLSSAKWWPLCLGLSVLTDAEFCLVMLSWCENRCDMFHWCYFFLYFISEVKVDLYPFGFNHDDHSLIRGDDLLVGPIKFESGGLPVFGALQKQLYVSHLQWVHRSLGVLHWNENVVISKNIPSLPH